MLLLADGYQQGPADRAGIVEARNAAGRTTAPARRVWSSASARDKWTPSLMPAAALDIYVRLCRGRAGAGDVGVAVAATLRVATWIRPQQP